MKKSENGESARVRLAFAHTVRQFREQRRLKKPGKMAGPMTQADMAEEVHMDRSYVTALESGEHNPTLTTIFKLLPVLKVTGVQFWRRLERNYKKLEAEGGRR